MARVARTSVSPMSFPTNGPSTASSQRTPRLGLPPEGETQFDEERFDGLQIVDHDEDVVHPFEFPILSDEIIGHG